MAFRNVKQIDFVHAAEKFNIKLGKSHMSQYVSGKTVPRADIAHFLAAFLQVNEDWLMGKDVPMEQNAVILPAIESDETQPDSNSASAQSTEGKTMRTFTKSHKLDNVLYDVRGPVADEAARMEAAGTHILKLNIGNPAPFGFRRGILERIAPIGKARLLQIIGKLAVRHRVRRQAGIHARLIQRKRVKRRKHADIRQNRRIILSMAIAVRGNVHDERNMEVRTPIHNRLGVFRHTRIEHLVGVVFIKGDGVKVARAQTTPAADAMRMIDVHLAGRFIEHQTIVGALALAAAASAADLLVDARLAVGMLLGLARTRAAAHADILDRAAEPGRLMSLEVGQADENVGVHDGSANPRFLHVFAARDRNADIIRALQAVADDHRATDRQRCEAVLPRAV